ncbi:MAG TPA: FecR domain-containing protein [Gemmatimonadaceae bacterium]|nr:FecR domain-containing protein [Gemmatimonadaceae bacterium]
MPVPHHGIDVLAERKSKAGPIIGLVLFLVVAAGLLWYLNRAGNEAALEKAFQSPDVASYTSKAGQTAKTTFEDSTALNLGADTKLVVPPGYGQRWRAVQLDGTVELTPPPNADPPLDVRARNVSITSNGGTVGVHAYTTDNWIAVRVKGGSATVTAPGGSQTVADGQGAIVDSAGAVRAATAAELTDAFSWVDGNLTITQQPLSEAIKRIRRWYGMELNVKDKALLTRPVSMSATIAESAKMIDALQSAAQVKFGYEGGRMVLADASGR